MVDDNDTSRSILDKLLSRRGLKTALADSGPAALEALQDASESGNPFKLDRSRRQYVWNGWFHIDAAHPGEPTLRRSEDRAAHLWRTARRRQPLPGSRCFGVSCQTGGGDRTFGGHCSNVVAGRENRSPARAKSAPYKLHLRLPLQPPPRIKAKSNEFPEKHSGCSADFCDSLVEKQALTSWHQPLLRKSG